MATRETDDDVTPDDDATPDPASAALRDHFLGWQCRIRQLAVRQAAGRPTPGMEPRALRPDGTEIAPRVTVLIVPKDPTETTRQLRHMGRRTHDPLARYKSAIGLLSSAYFQRPHEFSDVMTALFSGGSPVAVALLAEGRCVLEFEQYNQSYRIPCVVAALDRDHPAYQATYWHNFLFNPHIPPDSRILAFIPDWTQASATPPI